MIYYILIALHVLVCFILILVVLLQSGKGADLAGALGGGATQTAFGSRGPASFLSRMTTVAAIVFMLTSIALSGMGRRSSGSSVLDGTAAPAAPVKQAPVQQPQTPAPTPDQIKKIQQEIESKQQQATPPPAASGTAKPEAAPTKKQ